MPPGADGPDGWDMPLESEDFDFTKVAGASDDFEAARQAARRQWMTEAPPAVRCSPDAPVASSAAPTLCLLSMPDLPATHRALRGAVERRDVRVQTWLVACAGGAGGGS